MLKNHLFSLILLFVTIACQQKDTVYVPKGLTKLSNEEMIERARNGDLGSAEDVVLKNEKGEIISRKTITTMSDLDDYWTVPYANAEGKVVEAIFRKATPEDKKLRAAISKVLNVDTAPEVKSVAINCGEKQQILQQVYESDQADGRQTINHEQDEQNLAIIISLIETCGMPTLKEVSRQQMMAIWSVIQHSDKFFMKKYLPLLEESTRNGDLAPSMIALTKDRVLMYEGKPQIYGSQVVNGKLWDLYEPAYVNQRRKEVGLEPMEDYLKMFDLTFEVPQKER
ncbi:MAG: DUF6624 domain-containing protein [Bacteroidota bacterium]